MRFLLPQTRREDTFVAKTALRARPSIGRRQLRVRADVRVSLTDGLAAPSGADLSFYRHVYHQAYARPPSFSFFRVHARGHGCLIADSFSPLDPQRPQLAPQGRAVALVVHAMEARLARARDVVRQVVNVHAGGRQEPERLRRVVK